MVGPTLAVIKRIFAQSHNQCAFVGCLAPLSEDSDTVTGEICHIKAAKRGGPRYDAKQSLEERHSASNLLLLCGRHHKIIDSEPRKYTVAVLTELKRKHEQRGLIEITPQATKTAQALLNNYLNIVVHSNTGQIAIQSPGAIQANTINLKTTKSKIDILPPDGSIAGDRKMFSYCKYLIDRYQQYQKADHSPKGEYKYIAIYNALKRHFKGDWKLMDQSYFPEVVAFLKNRIDKTMQGKINKSKTHRNYHEFHDHA
jgi:hypothetical protein